MPGHVRAARVPQCAGPVAQRDHEGGALDDGALRLTRIGRYPVIADAVAGRNGELTLVVLTGAVGDARLAGERVAANGSRLGVLYRSRAYNPLDNGQPSVTVTRDATDGT